MTDGLLSTQHEPCIPATFIRPPKPVYEANRGLRVPVERTPRTGSLDTRARACVSGVEHVEGRRSGPVSRCTLANETRKAVSHDDER